MELKTIFQSTEPSNKNVIWLQSINGVLIQKVFTAHGWQTIGNSVESPSKYTNVEGHSNNSTKNDCVSSLSLYEEYVNNGGKKTKEEFNIELFNLIG